MQTVKLGSRGLTVKVLQKKLNLIEDGIFGKLTLERVLEVQRNAGLVADGVVGPKTWEVLNDVVAPPEAVVLPNGMKRTSRRVSNIILHCTASPEDQRMTVGQIRNIHVKYNGWSDIGYHYVIYLDGSIHEGRNIDKVGAHCENHNTGSIGVVYVGGVVKVDGKLVPKDTRTMEQKKALVSLVKKLMDMYGLGKDSVHGHYEYANKACPSFNIESFRKEL